MDKKELFMTRVYRDKFNNHTFDETDICAFLILIREHLVKELVYMKDFADLIAHRHRNKGVASSAITGAINSE